MNEQSFQHHIPYISARIEMELQNETNIATGFFYFARVLLDNGRRSDRLLLISNRHVFQNLNGMFDQNCRLRIRLNRSKDNGTPDFGNVYTYSQNGFYNLYSHPDPMVDLACLDVTNFLKTKNLYLKHLHDAFLRPINYEKVLVGSDVIYVGYPNGLFDNVNNLPLVRRGSIASIPHRDFNGHGHIVLDAQIFNGSSGSPVFVDCDGQSLLLGVVSDMLTRNSTLQALPANMPKLGIQESVGLGLIVKQRHVQELINHFVHEIRQIIYSNSKWLSDLLIFLS